MTGITSFGAMTALEVRAGLLAREFSAEEVARGFLARIEALDGKVHAFLETTPEAALAAAARVDDALAAGRLDELGPLAGVPVAFKDNMIMAGAHATCGSRVLENHVPAGTATCVQRMLDAGAIPLGKLNMDEFAFGSSTETSSFGRTANPWDLKRVPGGSSGGSAAAVAAGLAPLTLGSDAGGSIRQPAAFCGVVGVKPSYGTISRHGIMAFINALDQAGPFARSVADAALALNVVSGRDALDVETRDARVDFACEIDRGVEGMTVGIVPSFMEAPGLSPEVRAAVCEAARALENEGARVVEVDLPHAQEAMSAYYVLGPREVFANLACFDASKYGCDGKAGFGLEARRRILLGAYLLSSEEGVRYHRAALKLRELVKRDYRRAFAQVDAILAPVTPRPAFKFGEITDPNEMHLSDMFTVSVNVAGNCGMSVPAGLGAESGLPLGVQVIADAFGDGEMLRVAAAVERAFGRAGIAPAFAGGL